MNKRGVSSIVATVLLILIVVATMGIVWATIHSILLDSVNVKELQIELFIQTDTGYTVYDNNKGYVFVQVARGTDDFILDAIDIILDVDGTTKRARVIAPGVNNAQSYLFDVNASEEHETVRASVAPIFLINDKKRLGQVTSEVLVPKKNINSEVALDIENGNVTFYELDFEEALEEYLDEEVPEEEIPIQVEGCKKGERRDIWNGCTLHWGTLVKVSSNFAGTKVYISDDAEEDWQEQEVKFYHAGDDDLECINTVGKCVEIINSIDHEEGDYLSLGSIDVLKVGSPCLNEYYYIYKAGSCENTLE